MLPMETIVNLPDDWKWLDELPEEWVAPEELRRPSSTIEYNLAIEMLAWDFLGREFCASVGRFVTESSLFKDWHSMRAKSAGDSLKEDALLALDGQACTRRCAEAWFVLVREAQAHGRDFSAPVVEQAVRQVKRALDEAVVRLQELRRAGGDELPG